MMYGREKSDRRVVPRKPANNAEPSATEGAEGRRLLKGSASRPSTRRTQRRTSCVPSAGWPHGGTGRVTPTLRPPCSHPREEPGAGCERKAGMSLPVKVWSVQSRAGGTGASLAGVAETRGLKRRQRLDGVWN